MFLSVDQLRTQTCVSCRGLRSSTLYSNYCRTEVLNRGYAAHGRFVEDWGGGGLGNDLVKKTRRPRFLTSSTYIAILHKFCEGTNSSSRGVKRRRQLCLHWLVLRHILNCSTFTFFCCMFFLGTFCPSKSLPGVC